MSDYSSDATNGEQVCKVSTPNSSYLSRITKLSQEWFGNVSEPTKNNNSSFHRTCIWSLKHKHANLSPNVFAQELWEMRRWSSIHLCSGCEIYLPKSEMKTNKCVYGVINKISMCGRSVYYITKQTYYITQQSISAINGNLFQPLMVKSELT